MSDCIEFTQPISAVSADADIAFIDDEVSAIDRYLSRSVLRQRLLGAVTALSIAAMGAGISIGVADAPQQKKEIVACERVHPGQETYCEDSVSQLDADLALAGALGAFVSMIGNFHITITRRAAASARRGYEREKARYLSAD